MRQLPAKQRPRVTEEERARRYRVIRDASSTAEAAEILALSKRAIRNLRMAFGLESPRAKRQRKRRAEIIQSYEFARESRQIAQEVDASQATVLRELRRMALPLRRGCRTIPASKNGSSKRARRWDAYCRSTNSKQAAERLGVTANSFSRWIRREGLPQYGERKEYRARIVQEARLGDVSAIQGCRMRRWRY